VLVGNETKRDVHLLAAVDEALLGGRDAFFLFDAFLYPRDLRRGGLAVMCAFSRAIERGARWNGMGGSDASPGCEQI
jgi:hypothetical protein